MTTLGGTFSQTFNDPFEDSTASTNQDAPYSFPISLNDHAYMVDLKQYSRTTLPARREAISQASEPGEQSLDTQGLWNRQQIDWRAGAGQPLWDIDGSNRSRFEDSTGFDPWHEHITGPLRGTSLAKSASNSNLRCFIINQVLYFVDGSNIFWASGPDSEPPAWQTPAAVGSPITGITNDGNFIFAAIGSAIKKVTLESSTVNSFGSFAADNVFYAAGRLLATKANNIVELDNAGALVSNSLNFNHFNSSFIWDGVIPTPAGIYAFGHTNDVSEVYFIDIDTTDGSLKDPSYADGFSGEKLQTLFFAEGVLCYGTNKGFRCAQLDTGTFGLTHGPLIPFYRGIQGFAQNGQFIYGGRAWPGAGNLIRFDLSTFTSSLVPAYANDIDSLTVGGVTDVAFVTLTDGDTDIFFCVSGVGIYQRTTTDLDSYEFTTGSILYGVFIKKIPTTLDFRCLPLNGGTISVFATPDDGQEKAIATLTTVGAAGPAEPIEIDIRACEEINLRFVMTGGARLKRWTLSAIPTPLRTEEIILPIILDEMVPNQSDQQIHYETLEEWLYLKGLEANGEIVTYQEGAHQWRVIIDTISWTGDPAENLAWTDDTNFLQGTLKLRLLTINAIT